MKATSAILLLGSSLILFSAAPVGAQSPDPLKSTGLPTTIYSGGEIDTVDTTSGNLRITIPLIHLPGRGLDTDITLTFNSKIWFTEESIDPVTGYSIYISNFDYDISDLNPYGRLTGPIGTALGWSAGVPRLGRYGENAWACQYYTESGCQTWVEYQTWVMNDGTRIGMADDGGIENCSGCNGMWSFDGTYMRFPKVQGLPPYLLPVGRYKDGTKVTPNVSYPPVSASITDTNGNLISCTPLTCTDTLGRTINFNWTDNTFTMPVRDNLLQNISYKDSSGTLQTITFTYQNLGSHYPMTWLSGGSYTAQGNTCSYTCYETGTLGWGTWLLTSVTLPSGKSYQFEYVPNPDTDSVGSTTGEVSKITMPTGGYIKYTYGWAAGELETFAQHRAITNRTVSSDGTPSSEQIWTYLPGNSQPNSISQVSDPLGNTQVIQFGSNHWIPTTITFKNASGVALKTLTRTPGCDETAYNDPALTSPQKCSNARILSETTTLNDTNQQSKVTYSYGTRGNVTTKSEYDWGVGSPGPLVRTTTSTYLHDSNSAYAANSNILNRVLTQNVCNSGATFCGKKSFVYDGTSPQATPNVVSHDYTNYPASYNLRANRTQVKRWNSTTSAWLTTTNTYNEVGNLLQTTDPGSHTTTFSFADNYYNYTPPQLTSAFVTQISRPVTNSVNHIQRMQYYFNSGLPSASCGENFPSSSGCVFGLSIPQPDYVTWTYDGLNRPLTSTNGDGGQSSLAYNETPIPITITETTKITSALNQVRTRKYDGLGRTSQLKLNSDPDGVTYTDTTYDALGRRATISNPYRTTSDSTYGITTYNYDALNRVTKLIPPDGTPSSDNVTTTYAGNCTTATDQAGKVRKSCTDAIGRLTTVREDPSGLNYETDYQYDVLDNLTSVVQNGSRQRAFVYNSLSQLTSSTNPESNTVPSSGATVATTYSYDNDENLSQKTMPAQNQQSTTTVTLTYCYDTLNRLTAKGYTAQTCTNGSMPSPVATYLYDQTSYNGLTITNGIGRRTGMSDAAGAEAWSFDVMGRVLTDRRTTNSVTKSTTYTYLPYVDGSLYQLTYPSGRTITYATGGAERLLSAVDNGNSINYALSATYTPQGVLGSTVLGQTGSFTGINLNFGFDKRLQPATIRGWSTNGTALDLAYNFNLGISDNGNVIGITNNRDGTRSQAFTYDSLNRILVGETTSTYATSPSHCWGETYVYDNQSGGGGAWGNLTNINVASTPYNGCTQESLSVTANTQNRISTSGYVYDTAGNLTNTPNPGGVTAQYNAENQVTSVAGVTYTYDGDGKRLKKSNGTLYWYGTGSDALDETDLSGNLTNEYMFFGGKRIARRDSSSNVYYYFEDHLGTSRVITNATGTVCYDADFYPFGGERTAYTITCPQNYKFTGKERDSESGLDNFGARYYSSQYGRFMIPDWSDDPDPVPFANFSDPQTLNLYAYLRDNPLNGRDGDGHHQECAPDKWDPSTNTLTAGECREVADPPSLPAESKDFYTRVYNFMASRSLYPCATVCYAQAVMPIGPSRGLAGLVANLTEDELTVFNELKGMGFDIQPIENVQGAKTADFLVNGVRTELKTLQTAGPNTLKNAIESGAKQGEQVIVDARKVGISSANAYRQAARAEGNVGGLTGRITILTKDGVVKF
jgi:RHS repeat-associated protein